jgi:hypothetical protein
VKTRTKRHKREVEREEGEMIGSTRGQRVEKKKKRSINRKKLYFVEREEPKNKNK